MNSDDVIRMAQEAGFGTLLTGNGLPTMWHGQDLSMLEKFAALVTAEGRKAIAIEMQQLRDVAMTAEKWRGIATAKFGDGRTVSEIEREACEALGKENERLRDALIDLISIVKIHQDATKNRFAWAEIDCAEEALKGGAA